MRGIVSRARIWAFYSLAEPRDGFHGSLVDCVGGCFGAAPELARDLAAAKQLARRGGCCPAHP
jgi:hypothetical protein